MTDRETGQEPDEFYVPTPEELERGIGPAARKRRKVRPEEAGGRGKLTELARRLFRLRPGVGRDRSEAPAPTTRPAVPDPSSPPSSAHPSSIREADDGPTPESSPAAPQPSEERQTRDQGTLPQPVEPTETPPSSSAKTKEQRLRRVTVSERVRRRPEERPAPTRVPGRVLAEASKASRRGHDLEEFKERRLPSAGQQDRYFVSQCISCGAMAHVSLYSQDNWTSQETGYWTSTGSAFEKDCSA